MNKKKITITWVIISLIILAVAIIGGIYFFGIIKQSVFGSGFTVKSISSNVPLISQDTDLNGVWFLVNAYTGGGQSIVGGFDPIDFKNNIGYSTQFPIKVTASALDETGEYKLMNSGEGIYNFFATYQFSSNGFTGTGSGCATGNKQNAPSCPSGTDYEIKVDITSDYIIYKTTYTCIRICEAKKQIGVIADIEPTRVVDQMDITLSVNGEVITKRISSDNPNADFYSNLTGLVAQVQYPANGWTGNFMPSAQQYKGYYDLLANNKWSITSSSHLSDYRSTFSSVDANLRSWANINYQITGSALDFLNTVKSETGRLASKVTQIREDDMSLAQNTVWGNRNDQQNGKLTINLDRQIAVADLIFKIKASWIGVMINVGKPSIVSSTCNDFKAGDNGKIDVQVKNIGNSEGSFVGSITCGTIVQSYTITPTFIGAGLTKTISIPLNAGTFAGDKYDSCSIIIQDFNKASNSATGSVTCHILKPAICIERDFYNEGNCIKKCTNGLKENLKCCEDGQEISFAQENSSDGLGGYYCRDKEYCKTHPADPSCVNGECKFTWYKLGLDGVLCKLKAWFTSFFNTLKWIIVILGGLLSGLWSALTTRKLTGTFNLKNKTQWIISIIVGLIIGISVGLIAYYIWWTSIIALIIFGIIKWIF